VQEPKKNIILIGYSGHAYVLCEALIESDHNILGYTEKKEIVKNPFNLNYLGNEEDEDFKYFSNEFYFIVGIGNNLIRSKISKFLRSKSCNLVNVIHPSASIFNKTNLGSGVFIARNVAINSFCTIKNDVIINTSASIDHECFISSGVHIAPGAVLLGNVEVGLNSFVGANSVVKEGVKIGENVVIGAGSVVLKDVKDNSIIYGNPAKEK
jgi:sugar O-acyltransferase (sialic acid O-acetyltransferase NeuD family)